MLHLKDLWGRSVGERVSAWGGKILNELEGLRAIEARGKRASMVRGHPPFRQGPESATAKCAAGERRK